MISITVWTKEVYRHFKMLNITEIIDRKIFRNTIKKNINRKTEKNKNSMDRKMKS